jgi:uncharacterized protein (TIGR03083 family)
MPTSPMTPVDTRGLFRPVSSGLVALLRGLPPEDWAKPTIAGTWLVRDIVAHLVDLTFRRLSFHRDAMTPPPPSRPIRSERDFVDFINGLNAEWIGASKRFSPRVLTDLFELASRDLADWFEALPLEAPALFGVSWAGEMTSEGWFDVAREFTELWHHQQQIRLAVGAPLLNEARFLRPVIEISLRALPHTFRDQKREPGCAIAIDVAGAAGGTWTLSRAPDRWMLETGEPARVDARAKMTEDTAWRLLLHALPADEAERAIQVTGDRELAAPLVRARAVIV